MKRILQILIVLAFIFVVGGFLLNKQVQVSIEKTFNYPVEEVFNQINNLKNWANWNFWQQKDSEIEIEYGDIYEGYGAEYAWGSQKGSIGNGSLAITESVRNENLSYTIDFGGKGKGEADVLFDILSKDRTRVVWSFESKVDGLLAGWFALMMKKMVKRSFKKSLDNLEQYLKDNYLEEEEFDSFDFEKVEIVEN